MQRTKAHLYGIQLRDNLAAVRPCLSFLAKNGRLYYRGLLFTRRGYQRRGKCPVSPSGGDLALPRLNACISRDPVDTVTVAALLLPAVVKTGRFFFSTRLKREILLPERTRLSADMEQKLRKVCVLSSLSFPMLPTCSGLHVFQ